ncbi:MAG: hypothetical protein Q9199_001730 [Rusavskia elegans]
MSHGQTDSCPRCGFRLGDGLRVCLVLLRIHLGHLILTLTNRFPKVRLQSDPTIIHIWHGPCGGPARPCRFDAALATDPQDRVAHDIVSYSDKLHYLKGRTQRILNKATGRPATPETPLLADVVAKLEAQVEDTLGEGDKMTRAVLSSPDGIPISDEEISTVFDYLKTTNLMSIPDDLENLYATSAAFAGFGFVLCRNYTDPYTCEREEQHFPSQRRLHIDFTPDSLTGTIRV